MTSPPIGRLVLVVTCALFVSMCRSAGEPSAPVAAVTIEPVSAEVVVGGTVQLTAATWDAAGGVLHGRVVTWAQSDPTVGTVSATGLATAVAGGSLTITATSEGQRGTSIVTVHLAMGV